MKPIDAYSIRRGSEKDLRELQKIFIETIQSVCHCDYDEQQIQAWAAAAENQQRWHGLVNEQFLLVAEKDNSLIGFGSLANENCIDFLHVHKGYQRRGVAREIYLKLEEQALR